MAARAVYLDVQPLILVLTAALAALTALPSARADSDLIDPEPRYSLSARALLSHADIGDITGSVFGGGVSGLWNFSRVGLSLDLDALAGAPTDRVSEERESTRHQRARLLLQIPAYELATSRFRGTFALTVGAGAERISFRDKSPLRRDFVSWGLRSRNGFTTKRFGGSVITFDYGFDFDIARAPAARKRERPPGCAGPCDSLSVTNPIDVSYSFVLATTWGPTR